MRSVLAVALLLIGFVHPLTPATKTTRFDFIGGQAVSGPTRIRLPVYAVRIEDEELWVEVTG